MTSDKVNGKYVLFEWLFYILSEILNCEFLVSLESKDGGKTVLCLMCLYEWFHLCCGFYGVLHISF